MQIKINKLPKSEVEIEGELEAEVFETYFDKALKRIGENLEVDGFRKGKVPKNILLSKIPEAQILGEMAEMALSENYPKILEENKIDAISRPEISITKLARKNELGFKIKTTITILVYIAYDNRPNTFDMLIFYVICFIIKIFRNNQYLILT